MSDEGPQTLEIPKWDPTTMLSNSVSLVVGARHSGKSVLITAIMYYMRMLLDTIVGISPTEEENETLAQFTPPCFIHYDFDEKLVHAVIEWQRTLTKKDAKARKAARKAGHDPASIRGRAPSLGLVMDDCMGEVDTKGKSRKVMKSGDVDRLFKLGRHWKFFYLCCMQYIKDAPPAIRGNTDYAFFFSTNNVEELEKIHANFFGQYSFKQFKQIFAMATSEKYNCLVLDVRASRAGKGNGIFYYMAENRTRDSGGVAFRVGRPVYWHLSEYAFRDDVDDKPLDPNTLRGVVWGKPAAGAGGSSGPAPMLTSGSSSGKAAKTKPEFVVTRKPSVAGSRHKSFDKSHVHDKSQVHDRSHDRSHSSSHGGGHSSRDSRRHSATAARPLEYIDFGGLSSWKTRGGA